MMGGECAMDDLFDVTYDLGVINLGGGNDQGLNGCQAECGAHHVEVEQLFPQEGAENVDSGDDEVEVGGDKAVICPGLLGRPVVSAATPSTSVAARSRSRAASSGPRRLG